MTMTLASMNLPALPRAFPQAPPEPASAGGRLEGGERAPTRLPAGEPGAPPSRVVARERVNVAGPVHATPKTCRAGTEHWPRRVLARNP